MQDTTILIVEDDAIAQLTFLQYLKDLGYDQTLAFANGQDALDALQHTNVDLAFLDIRIHGELDGVETAKRIREFDAQLPFIFVTASTDRQTIRRALSCQPYGIITKPYDFNTLRESIDNALTYRNYQEKIDALDSRYMLDQILDTADVGISVTNEQGTFLKVNNAYCALFGYSKQELVGRHFTIVLPENIHKYARTLHEQYVTGKTEESNGEWKAVDKYGHTKDVFLRVGLLVGDDGQRYKISTVSDLTERNDNVRRLTEALDEKESYAREIHHRVKNNMNIISGLLYLQAEKVKSRPFVYDLFQESINRIKTLSIIHEQLYRQDNYTSIDLEEYFQSLVSNVQSLFRDNSGRITVHQEVARLPLDVDRAIACGLIINEVISNSFKYAFPDDDQPSPEIKIKAYTEGASVHIIIQDNGIGLPAEFDLNNGATLGFQLISNLTQQLNGKIEVGNQNGTRVYLQFPQ